MGRFWKDGEFYFEWRDIKWRFPICNYVSLVLRLRNINGRATSIGLGQFYIVASCCFRHYAKFTEFSDLILRTSLPTQEIGPENSNVTWLGHKSPLSIKRSRTEFFWPFPSVVFLCHLVKFYLRESFVSREANSIYKSFL